MGHLTKQPSLIVTLQELESVQRLWGGTDGSCHRKENTLSSDRI